MAAAPSNDARLFLRIAAISAAADVDDDSPIDSETLGLASLAALVATPRAATPRSGSDAPMDFESAILHLVGSSSSGSGRGAGGSGAGCEPVAAPRRASSGGVDGTLVPQNSARLSDGDGPAGGAAGGARDATPDSGSAGAAAHGARFEYSTSRETLPPQQRAASSGLARTISPLQDAAPMAPGAAGQPAPGPAAALLTRAPSSAYLPSNLNPNSGAAAAPGAPADAAAGALAAAAQWRRRRAKNPAGASARRQSFSLFNNPRNSFQQSRASSSEFSGAGDAQAPRTWLLFEVVDSGVGVTPEGLRHLFQQFVQVRAVCTVP